MDCVICCERVNKTTRKEVTCGFCSHTACLACTKQYLLQSVQHAHCMKCRKEWTMEILRDMVPHSFLKDDYRTMRETVLFEEEKTYFPLLLNDAERTKRIRVIRAEIAELTRLRKENDANEDQFVRTQRATERGLKEKVTLYYTLNKVKHKKVSDEVAVLMKCPMDECRGFLSQNYHCGMCDTDVCKHCHVADTEEHKCNPDDMATITELKNTTRPCPKCSVRIFKTDGCDQMFCVKCHTAFSWRTGREEQGVIHNPHYFETLRAGGIQTIRHRQEHGGCGAIPSYRSVMVRIHLLPPKEQEQCFGMYQQIVHHRHMTLPTLMQPVHRDVARIKYLIGDTDEKLFKQRLYVHHHTELRRQEEHRIVDSYVTIGEEKFRGMVLHEDDPVDTLNQLILLRTLTCIAIDDLDKKYVYKGYVSPADIMISAL